MAMGQSKMVVVFLCCAVPMLTFNFGETANDFLQSKWRARIELYDHDKNGVVRYEDMERAKQWFLTASKLEGEKRTKADEDFTRWWVDYILRGNNETTVDEYVARNNELFEAGTSNFTDEMLDCCTLVVNLYDTSDDGFVSEKEQVILWETLGHANVTLDKASFQTFNPLNNKVPVESMIFYWTQYLTSEDENAPDKVNKAIENL